MVSAQTSYGLRALSLDSRYFIHGYSNSAVGRFGIEMIHLGGLPANLIFEPDSVAESDEKMFLFYNARQLSHVGEGLTLLVGSASLALGFHLAYHEYGHGTRLAAIGYEPIYGHGMSEKTYQNFLSYYFSSLFDLGGWTSYRGQLFRPVFEEGWDGLFSMAGVNNSMFFSEMVEDELYRYGGHIGFSTSYVLGKLTATGPGPASDIRNVLEYYRSRGFDIDRRTITRAATTSLLLSALSYQFAYQFVKLAMGESVRFHAWEIGGVQLPNSAFYLTRAGLSYKIRSGYRYDSWRFPVAVEYVFEGESRTEISFGAENQFGDLSAKLQTIIGRKFELELELDYRFNDWFLLSGGYALYDKNNLHGERLIPSLQYGSTYHDIYLRASLVY